MGHTKRDVVWTPTALSMFDDTVDLVASRSELARDDFIFEIVEAADSLEKFADDGRVVPELGNWKVREIIVGRYRLQYHLTPERAEVVALCRLR